MGSALAGPAVITTEDREKPLPDMAGFQVFPRDRF